MRSTSGSRATITVHMAMRYQAPSMDEVLETMRLENYDKIVILPMFPHYASSEHRDGDSKPDGDHLEVVGDPQLEVVNQFYDEAFYIDTVVEQARKHDLTSSFDHVVISYHGLPDRHVDKVYEGKENLCRDHHCDERRR